MSIYEGFRVNGDVALFFWFCSVVDVDYALAFGKIEHADVIVIGAYVVIIDIRCIIVSTVCQIVLFSSQYQFIPNFNHS